MPYWWGSRFWLHLIGGEIVIFFVCAFISVGIAMLVRGGSSTEIGRLSAMIGLPLNVWLGYMEFRAVRAATIARLPEPRGFPVEPLMRRDG